MSDKMRRCLKVVQNLLEIRSGPWLINSYSDLLQAFLVAYLHVMEVLCFQVSQNLKFENVGLSNFSLYNYSLLYSANNQKLFIYQSVVNCPSIGSIPWEETFFHLIFCSLEILRPHHHFQWPTFPSILVISGKKLLVGLLLMFPYLSRSVLEKLKW